MPEYLYRREAIIVAAERDIRKVEPVSMRHLKAQLLYHNFDRAISRALERLDRISAIPIDGTVWRRWWWRVPGE